MSELGKQKNFSLSKIGRPSLEVLSLFTEGAILSLIDVTEMLIEGFQYKSISQAMSPSRSKLITLALVRNGLLVKDKKKKFRLSPKGRWELARHRLLDAPQEHVAERWDSKWRLVVFDIPELERKQRDMLRRAISSYGMYQLQQSVWVYPYSCSYLVDSIKNDLGFRSEVLTMLVEEIENQEELEREFGLR